MAEIDLVFLCPQVPLVLGGQRQTNIRLAAIEAELDSAKAALADTATSAPLLSELRKFESQFEVAELWAQLPRETLEVEVKEAEVRLDALDVAH